MSEPKTLTAAREALTSLEGQLATANTNLGTANARVTELEGQLTKANTDLSAANARIAELEGQISKANTDLAAANESLTKANGEIEKLNKEATDASTKAQRIVGQLGVPPIEGVVDGEGMPKSDMSAFQTWKSIKDPVEAGKYFAANRDKILS